MSLTFCLVFLITYTHHLIKLHFAYLCLYLHLGLCLIYVIGFSLSFSCSLKFILKSHYNRDIVFCILSSFWVLFSFCLTFCQSQPNLAYKSVACKKACTFKSWAHTKTLWKPEIIPCLIYELFIYFVCFYKNLIFQFLTISLPYGKVYLELSIQECTKWNLWKTAFKNFEVIWFVIFFRHDLGIFLFHSRHVSFLRYSFYTLNRYVNFKSCDVKMSISAKGWVHFWLYLLIRKWIGHETRATNRYSG